MTKTIMITGATDGIGFETAKMLAPMGHNLLLHGRSREKLATVAEEILAIEGSSEITTYRADLSDFSQVKGLSHAIKGDVTSIDALINNAGVFKMTNPVTSNGYDALHR